MKTKEKDKREESYKLIIIVALGADLILSILSMFFIAQFNQANVSLSQQKTQIANLTNLLNLNKSQVIFNKPILIGPSRLISTPSFQIYTANMTLHFNFTHAGYIVINTTGQSQVDLILMQNYSKTWLGTNDSGVWGTFNFSVRSLTMPVLPGPATLILLNDVYSQNTTPYKAQLTITYHS